MVVSGEWCVVSVEWWVVIGECLCVVKYSGGKVARSALKWRESTPKHAYKKGVLWLQPFAHFQIPAMATQQTQRHVHRDLDVRTLNFLCASCDCFWV